jgi:hypothetical protein
LALPAGLTPKTLTIGIPTKFNGSPASGSATLTAPKNLVHTPTGTPLFSGKLVKQFSGLTEISFTDLVPTDAAGLNRVDWTYTLEVRINGAVEQPEPVPFLLPSAGPDTVDAELLVSLPSSAGTPVSVSAVLSIAGLSGTLTAAQVATALDASGNRLSDVALRAAFDTRRDPTLAVTAPNAPIGFSLTTPDGSGQITHSSIVKVPGGGKWNGYRYWMAATPYANQNDQLENPNIYAANDPKSVGGRDGWQIPAGLTNPIEPTPPDGALLNVYNSDPDLEFGPDGKLYCFWRLWDVNNVGSEERIYVRSSADGITWSAKTLVLSNDRNVTRPCAPSVVFDGTTWHMWAVDIVPSPNTIVHYTASSPTGPWTLGPACTLNNVPTGRDPWHIDVNRLPSGAYHMLINDVALGIGGGGGRLYLAESTDGGTTWTCADHDFISTAAGRWDNLLYRSSMVYSSRGDSPGYEVIYSGISSFQGATDWRIAYTSTFADSHADQVVHAHSLAVPNLLNILAARVPLPPFVMGDAFRRADGPIGAAESGQTWTVDAGTPTIVGNKVSSDSGIVNTRARIATGISDFYAELTVSDIAAFTAPTSREVYLLARASGPNDFFRFGLIGAGRTMTLQRVQVGAVTSLVSYSLGAFHPGIRLGLRCSGSTLTCVVDGRDVYSVTDTFNQTATGVGWADHIGRQPHQLHLRAGARRRPLTDCPRAGRSVPPRHDQLAAAPARPVPPQVSGHAVPTLTRKRSLVRTQYRPPAPPALLGQVGRFVCLPWVICGSPASSPHAARIRSCWSGARCR